MRHSAFRVRKRVARGGPESRLLKAALRSGLPFSSPNELILFEALLPSGVPDMIAVAPRLAQSQVSRVRSELGVAHLRILHFLSDSRRASLADIERLLNFSKREAINIVDDLIAARLVVRKDKALIVPTRAEVFVARRIVAVEAKMRAWRDALEQAVTNLWFASHSYVLLPVLKCLRSVCQEARKLGIGVLVFDGKRTRTIVQPRKQAIPASYGSWVINEWAIHQLR